MSEDEIDRFLNEISESAKEESVNSPLDSSLRQLFDNKLNELNLTQNAVEALLNIETRALKAIIDRTSTRVDAVSIIKVANFLGLPIETFFTIYLHTLPADARKKLEESGKASYIIQSFDLKNLKKIKFLSSLNDYSAIEEKIIQYFKLKDIRDYSLIANSVAFSKTQKTPSLLMREFWIKSAYAQFEKIANPNMYFREKLVALLPKIRPYTLNEREGLQTVIQALYNIGITVIYQPHLPLTQVRGATGIVNNKPCIVLSDLNKNYGTIWFALIHELHHVLYDLEDIAQMAFHLTGEPDLFLLQEDKANEFARQYLFSQEASRHIEPFIDDEMIISEYAKKNGVHRSIIYNFYAWDKQAEGESYVWGKYRKYFPDVETTLGKLNINPWQNESIEETAKYLKENIFNNI